MTSAKPTINQAESPRFPRSKVRKTQMQQRIGAIKAKNQQIKLLAEKDVFVLASAQKGSWQRMPKVA